MKSFIVLLLVLFSVTSQAELILDQEGLPRVQFGFSKDMDSFGPFPIGRWENKILFRPSFEGLFCFKNRK